jgi:predicted SnoaL-like aldol condensation-catalyzing enzyme
VDLIALAFEPADLMPGEGDGSARHVVARYFEMWNSGESSIAAEVLSADWVDHAHPEVSGPEGVQQAVETIRAAQPDLRFRVDAILGDGDLVAVVGAAVRGGDEGMPSSCLIWLVRLAEGRMVEMWTYRQEGA